MKRRELLDWLSLTTADIPGWLALVAVAGMYFIRNFIVDLVLTALAVALAATACYLSQTPNPELSERNNLARKWTSRFFLVIIVLLVIVHFAFWDYVMDTLRQPLPVEPGPNSNP